MHFSPVFEGDVFRILRAEPFFKADDAGVVHEDVDMALFALDGAEDLFPLLFLAHIEMHVSGVELVGRFLAYRIIDVGEDDMGAFFDE